MSFANLSVKLTADIKDFSRKMSEAVAQSTKLNNAFGSKIGSKGGAMLSFATDLSDKYKEATKELRSHNLGLKDTARIVQGIMISQAFYAAVGAIRDATSALWNFNTALDYMQVTYSALFGSADLAKDFMSVLQEHSIETIFDYQSLADASKKLLAYGIEYKNLMFIMEGLTNLGAMSGDSAALDRIALALGQIYTKGKLSAEEMRQLANAYIPITEILQEKFGLTGEELKRVGELNIPAADVINAIVDYANENFGSVGDAAMHTITGLQNRIVDTLKVVGASMMQPLTTAYKSFLAYVSSGLESIRTAYETGGVGGVFEFLVPDPGTQKVIRQFLANIHNLLMSLASVGAVVGKVFGNVAQVVATAFNMLSPIVFGFVNILSLVINKFLSTEFGAGALRIALVGAAAAFVLLKVQALGALVITVVTKAVNGLSKALLVLSTIVSKHPIVSLLVALAVVLLGVSVSSSSANDSISGLFDTLSGAAGGTSSDEVLQKVNQSLRDSADAADQFNKRLEGSTDAANDLRDAIGGAGKEAKKTSGLLSFDEVFKLPEQKESDDKTYGYNGGLLGDLENLAQGFNTLGDALIPEIPDFSEFTDAFADSLFGGLESAFNDKIKDVATGAGIGGILGLIIGAIFKNPKLGMWIGTGVGGFATYVWQELEGAVSNAGVGGGVGVWTAISSAITKAGATVGLGTLLKNAFTQGGISGLWNALAGTIKTTGVKAIAKGGIVGIAVGLVVDGIAHNLWKWLDEEIASADADAAKIGQTIGSILGTVIGAIIGGPAGALIGSAIGTFVGGFIGLFWEPISEFFVDLGSQIGAWVADAWSDVSAWWADTTAGFSTWATDTGNGLSTWWTETTDGFSTWATDTENDLSAWWTDTKAGFTTWWIDTKSGLSTWWSDTVNTFSSWEDINSETLDTWFNDTMTSLNSWGHNTIRDFSSWWDETTGGFSTWYDDTMTSINSWGHNTIRDFSTWWDETSRGFNDWYIETDQVFWGWYYDMCATVDQFIYDTIQDFSSWANQTAVKMRTWRDDAVANVSEWYSNTSAKIDTWVRDTINDFSEWANQTAVKGHKWKEDFLTVIGGFAISAGKKLDKWLSDTGVSLSTWFNNTKEDVKKGWNTLWDPNTWKSGWSSVHKWFSDLCTDISNWFTNIGKSISNWWDGLWSGKEVNVNTSSNGASISSYTSGGSSGVVGSSYGARMQGHAAGGIFNREHIARFAEGNKAEAIIPLENRGAMQPFVDAVSDGIVSSLAPIVATVNANSSSNLPPLYVGTLIADERGLKELYKKFEVIQLQENDRRGLHART